MIDLNWRFITTIVKSNMENVLKKVNKAIDMQLTK